MGDGVLDDLAKELADELVEEFGGTGTLEIKAITNPENGFETSPDGDTTVFLNINITPPSTMKELSSKDPSVMTRLVEIFVPVSQVIRDDEIVPPVENQAWLTIHQANFINSNLLDKRMKVVEVNEVMGGNKVVMYQLKCKGAH